MNEKLSFSLELFSGHFYGQSFIKTVRGPLVKLTFRTAISSHQVMGMLSKKNEVWKIYQTEYGPFLATDWLKSKIKEEGGSWATCNSKISFDCIDSLDMYIYIKSYGYASVKP